MVVRPTPECDHRTRGPFWSRPRPARILVGAVVATQLVATGLAISGLLMAPISLWWALLVWGYALVWFLIEDRVKLLAYRILERQRPASAAQHARRTTLVTPE